MLVFLSEMCLVRMFLVRTFLVCVDGSGTRIPEKQTVEGELEGEGSRRSEERQRDTITKVWTGLKHTR